MEQKQAAKTLNFEEFKKRYFKRLEASGFHFQALPQEEQDNLVEQVAAIFNGLSVFNEFQMEAQQEFQREMKRANKPGIILPGGGRLN